MSLTVGNVNSTNSYSNKVAFGSKVPSYAKFKIVHPQLWEKHVKQNKGGFYRDSIISFAARWAKGMEQAMRRGAKFEDVVEIAKKKADTEGVSGFMEARAIKILSDVWQHGKAIKNWNNAQFGVEKDAKGVVNWTIIHKDSE